MMRSKKPDVDGLWMSDDPRLLGNSLNGPVNPSSVAPLPTGTEIAGCPTVDGNHELIVAIRPAMEIKNERPDAED